jgi:VanZ family protein
MLRLALRSSVFRWIRVLACALAGYEIGSILNAGWVSFVVAVVVFSVLNELAREFLSGRVARSE